MEAPNPTGKRTEPQLKDATIMMVDDEPTTLEVMEMLLRAEGYERIVRISDSRQTLERITAEQPDLVLLNLMMPHIDGLELLRSIRTDPEIRDLPVVIVTGSTDSRTKQRALENGASDFLGKPIDPSELSLRVRNILTASALGPATRTPRKLPRPTRRSRTTKGSPLISQLTGIGDRSRAIVAVFVERLKSKLTEMEGCLERDAFDELQALAHWLKGAGGTVGFDEFTEPAEMLRLLAKEAKRSEVGPAIEALWDLADRIVLPGDDESPGKS